MCHPKGRSAAKDARSALTRRPARSYSAPTIPATVRHARRRSGERHERSRPPALPAPLADPPIAPQPTHTRLRRAPFSRGIPPPAGVSRSLPREPGNRPPGSQGAPGPGGNLPRNPGARPFSTSTPRAAPCDTRAGRCNPRRGQPSGMHPAHTGHQSRPLLDTRAPPFRGETVVAVCLTHGCYPPPAVRPRLNRGRRQPAARRDPLDSRPARSLLCRL